MRIHSPMATGNGAYIVHKAIERELPGYRVCGHSPWWTLFPPSLYALCQDRRADLVHTTPDYAPFFRQRGRPLVLTFHNFVLDRFMADYSSAAQRLHYQGDLRWLTSIALRQADAITAVSRFTAELARQDMRHEGEIRVIYNGIDTSRFVPAARERKNLFRILFAGNMTRRKGADLLPAIAASLAPGIRIDYATGLRTRSRLPETPKLHCLGPVRAEDMPALYREVDALLFPTVREGFGLVAAEAMACGLPVVASNCSALPELVADREGGFLCPLGDVAAFADALNILADSPQLNREMGEFNRARVERHFKLEDMIENYRLLFEETADNYGRLRGGAS